MKICVYAIAKNEEKFVDRFMDACGEADAVCVLDTGSTDSTVEKLADRGAIVHQEEIVPWRFDTARNRSMELLPEDTDVAVCVDLDEVLSKGWRRKLEMAWTPKTEQANFMCVRSRNKDGSLGTAFYIGRAHRPGVFRWKYPVHEVLKRCDGAAIWGRVDVPDMEAEHMPDKEKSRGQYLPLLELGAREYPDDPRCAHYLGREYMYHQMWDEAIRELKRHLSIRMALWVEERSASMRYLAECYLRGKGDMKEAMSWALRACAEAWYRRENWYEAERVAYFREDWAGTEYFGERALECHPSKTCINEGEAWGAGPYDLMSVARWRLGKADKALESAERALELAGDDERIRKNVEYLRRAVRGEEKTG